LQTGRAWLWSLLKEIADTAIDAGPDAGALVALPADLLAEIRAAVAACPEDFSIVTTLARCAKCRAPLIPETRCGRCLWDELPEGGPR